MFDLGAVVAHINADASGFNEGIQSAQKSLNGFSDGLKKVGSGIKSFADQATIFTGIATAGAIAFGKASLDAYNEAEASAAQLVHAVRDVTHATGEELAATFALSNELERKGVLDGDNINIGLAQLSTFGLTNKAVRGLGQSLTDLAVNQFGVHATGEQLSQTANMIAKALNGQFGVLEKSGIRFTEAQKHMIEFGKESEKVKAINEGFAQNLKYTNDVALTTLDGKLAAINVRWGNFQEGIGGVINALVDAGLAGDRGGISTDPISALIPNEEAAQKVTDVLNMLLRAFIDFGTWVQNNQATVITFLQALGVALTVLLVIGTINGLLIALTNPLVLASIAIGALYLAWQSNFLGIQGVVQWFVDGFVTLFNDVLMPFINLFVGYFVDRWVFIQEMLRGVWNIMVGIIQIGWAIISGLFALGIGLLTGNWQQAWDKIKAALDLAWTGIKNLFTGIIGFIKGWGGELLSELVRPFQDAWNQISALVNKIKDALDFTKRHSPSVVDIVKTGVAQVNKAMSDLEFSTTMAPDIAGATVSNGGQSTMINDVNIDLSGAVIADQYSANKIAEAIGDSIIKKLQTNIRF